MQKTFGWKRNLNFPALIKVCKQKFTSLADEHLSGVRDGPVLRGGGIWAICRRNLCIAKNAEKQCKGSRRGKKMQSKCFLHSSPVFDLKELLHTKRRMHFLKVKKIHAPENCPQ